ncbi:hypothetical protein [Dyadobacter frigoris]|uniref:Uncharacterized protein n=1 Tax=Dyadobacter frigoris TaxID=2576211 RepID=A0A4U6D135_9BACT|nr:hypothetical protein [Dyadobacter frigoris]TKT90909.1 hypothetical protein FDK13_18255 [Dyadobacter frigoris]GLU56727.1 hypothetical protein Dfri01_61880 [Dyadobacter frigoris]
MIIEQQNQDLIIRVTAPADIRATQKVVDYLNLMESISKNQGTEEQATELARDVHNEWWIKNRSLFIR